MRRLETPEVIGGRKASTEWTSCFGARHYQPHFKLLRPGSEIERDLRPIDEAFLPFLSDGRVRKIRSQDADTRKVEQFEALLESVPGPGVP